MIEVHGKLSVQTCGLYHAVFVRRKQGNRENKVRIMNRVKATIEVNLVKKKKKAVTLMVMMLMVVVPVVVLMVLMGSC